jgi:hypothetical protein
VRAPFRSILFFGGVWCLKSLTQRKRKRMMMNTRGLTDGWKTKFFSVFFHFFPFFVEKVQKEENLFLNKTKISFSISTSEREEEKESGERKSIENRQRKRSTALQRLQ